MAGSPSTPSKSHVTIVVVLYFVVSISLVFVNKHLMSSSNTTIRVPLFVTWYQCALTALIIYVAGRWSSSAKSDSWLKEFPPVWTDWRVAIKVLPLSVVFVLMITLNNLCLNYVSVPFYNVARSLTIVANVIFSFLLLNETTSYRVMLTLVIVILGFWIGVEGELEFSLVGTLFGVASSVFVSLNAIYTKKMMPFVENDKWKLSWYNNLNASIMFLPLILLSGEYDALVANAHILMLPFYWIVMNIAGIFGFAIGIVTVMLISCTSPLSFNICGTVKACIQTIFAVFFFDTPVTMQGLFGIFLTIFGSALYTYVRVLENDAKAASSSAAIAAAKSKAAKGPSNEADEDGEAVEMSRLLPASSKV